MVELSIPAAVGALVALVCHVFSVGPTIGLRCKRAAVGLGSAGMTVLCFAPEMWEPSLWILGLFLLIVLYQVGAILCMLLLRLGGCLKQLVCPPVEASV
jgi:hypothetical protein